MSNLEDKELKFGATTQDIFDTINYLLENNGGGTGSGYTELTTQYVRLWDLDAGIYKWTYDGQKYLYYNGASGTENVGIGTARTLEVYLQITSLKGTTPILTKRKAFICFYNNVITKAISKEYAYVYYGSTSVDEGSYELRNFANLPTDTPVTTSGSQTITGDKTFTGAVDFTGASVTGLSSGGGIPVLTTQTVNLADLEAGIYRWEYSDENGDTTKHFNYSNEGDTYDFYSNPVFIQVRQSGSGRFYYILDDNGMGIDENCCHIYYGGMDVEVGDGYMYTRDLSLIPTEVPDTTQYIKKTKITVAELKNYVANYNINYGKQVQLVYKGNVSIVHSIINSFSTLTIQKRNSLSKQSGFVDATESSLSGRKYTLNISASSADIAYYMWDYDLATTSIGDTQTIQITDSDFDIYIIG